MAREASQTFDGYIRISRVNGRAGDSFLSPEIQREAIERLALGLGVKVGEIVEERDVSGKTPIEKRELGRLIDKIEAGESGGILVWKMTRFSRNLLDGVSAISRITEAGGRLVGTDYNSDNKAIMGFLLGWAEEELDARRAGWKVAVDMAVDRGAYIGMTPVGFERNEDGTLRRNKDEKAVRAVFLSRAQGRSWNTLAEDLEAAGVLTAKGSPEWHINSVRSLIGNPIYKGILKNGHEHFVKAYAIVTGEEWDMAQEKGKAPVRRDGGAWALLSGLVVCEGCGHRMTPTRDRGYSYYRCQYRACPAKARADAAELEGLVVDEALAEFARRVSVVGVGSDQDVEKTTALEDALRRAKDAWRRHNANMDEHDAEDVAELDRLASEVEAAKAALDTEKRRVRRFPTIEEVEDVLESGSVEQKREALRRVVQEVRVERVGTRLKDEFRPADDAPVEFTEAGLGPVDESRYEPSKALADRTGVVWS